MLSLCLFRAFTGGCKLPYFISCLFSSPWSTLHPHLPSPSFWNLYIFTFFFLYSPTINTLTAIYFLLLKTEIVFAVILPRSNLLFLSQGKSYYDSAVSPQGGFSPAMRLRFFFFFWQSRNGSSHEIFGLCSKRRSRYCEGGKKPGLGDPLERETLCVWHSEAEYKKAILPLFVSHIVTAPKRQLVAFS